MKHKRNAPSRQEREEFEAYGEYSYAYLHDRQVKERQPDEPVSPPPASSAAAGEKRRQKRRRGVLIKMVVVLAALCILIIVLQETVFRLDAVYVIGLKEHSPQQVVSASGLYKGRNIFTVSEDEIAKNLEKDYSIIYQGMQIEYPNTIYLYVEERKPVAVMRWLGSQYELDAHGMVMSESDSMTLPEGMPLVTGFRVTAVHVGQTLSLRSQKQMDIYCQLLSELSLQEYADEVTEINLSDTENLYLITQEGISVRMGDGEYLRAKVGAIRTYIAYFRQLGTDSGVLDVSIPEDGKFMPER